MLSSAIVVLLHGAPAAVTNVAGPIVRLANGDKAAADWNEIGGAIHHR